MDYQNKYENVIGRFQYLIANAKNHGHIIIRIEDIENVITELKESDDERIRISIIEALQRYMPTDELLKEQEMVAWLEEQGKKKYADKKELKKIEQANVNWGEDDEYLLNETIQHLEELIRIDKAKHCACDVQYYQRDIDWLKSIKERIVSM